MKTLNIPGPSGRIFAAALVLLAVTVGISYALFRPDRATPEDHSPVADASDTTAKGHNALAAADRNGDGVVYRSGMHPWIIEDEPGQCPICGMDLVPTPVNASADGIVEIDPGTIQNIGVRTALVMIEPLGRSVRTTGRFEANQQLQTAVSPKISGWIEKLHVDYDGARVRRGQPLLEIYSPELVSTQEEYLLALRNAQRLAGTPAAADAERLVEAARRRLSYWDISEEQVRRLEETGKPQKTLTLYAPASGTVTGKYVIQGQQVTAGQTLIELADLSRIWLMVDVHEQDLPWVRPGARASIELPYDPGTTLTGTVDYIYDTINPETRTVQARITLPNPGLRLKPGMYATVNLTGGDAMPLPVVPEEAVIRTGTRDLVILALGGGRFRPVEVTLGTQADGVVQVLHGLSGGEEIVTSAQFLIDSEARLKSAVGAMAAGHTHGSTTGQHPPVATEEGGIQTVEITIGAAGYTPEQFQLKAGIPARLVFTRISEAGCGDRLDIPALGVKDLPLPLHEPVPVEFTPDRAGSFSFACGMDMLKGSIIVTS